MALSGSRITVRRCRATHWQPEPEEVQVACQDHTGPGRRWAATVLVHWRLQPKAAAALSLLLSLPVPVSIRRWQLQGLNHRVLALA
jgi:hypothetical protein